MSHDDEQPIGDILDGLGITAGIEPEALVSGAIVLLKIIQPDGLTRLSLSNSEGLGWIERVGMLRVAEAVETADVTGSRAPGA